MTDTTGAPDYYGTDPNSYSTVDYGTSPSIFSNSSSTSSTPGLDSLINPDSTVSSSSTTVTQTGLGDVLVGALVYGFKTIGNTLFTKGVILAALFWFVDFFINLFLELVATVLDMKQLTQMISQIPFTDFLKYLLYLGAFDYGIPLMLSAYLLKFFIRRLPVVG